MAKKASSVGRIRDGKHVYDAGCEVCGEKLGEVTFQDPRPSWNPKDAGLAHQSCLDQEQEE